MVPIDENVVVLKKLKDEKCIAYTLYIPTRYRVGMRTLWVEGFESSLVLMCVPPQEQHLLFAQKVAS